jgi:HD-GYP domain-containing protein (c-di-GMP phosphodiesterase class II)
MVESVTAIPDIAIGLAHIKSNNEFLYTHSVNVAIMMMGLAAILGFSKEKILDAGMAGMLHDIGAVRIPENVLRKEGSLTYHEMEVYKKHPLYGIEIVQKYATELSDQVLRVILSHHERFNGGGFPHKLKGEKIDDLVFLCAISDTFDRLTTDGVIRKACLPQEALALIFQGSDEEYPRKLVEYFTKLLGIYPIGSLVKLESGEMGIVIKINRDKLLFPQVVILFDSGGKKLEKPFFRNLASFPQEKYREMWKITTTLDPQPYNVQSSDIIFDYAV